MRKRGEDRNMDRWRTTKEGESEKRIKTSKKCEAVREEEELWRRGLKVTKEGDNGGR